MSLHLEGDTIDDLLRETYKHILGTGRPVENTQGDSLETVGASLVLHQPRNRISRTETRYIYVTPLAELCWYLSGSHGGEMITAYIDKYREYVETDGNVFGGYGPRIFGDGANRQVRNAADTLRKKPSSRRVVVLFLDKADMYGERHKDIPCTNTMQFLVRDGSLHSIVSMRSNDAWMGLVHDVFAFTMIQEMVARDLGVSLGTYTHFVGSLHLYQGNLGSARMFVDEGLQATTSPMDEMPQGSPWNGVEQLVAAEQAARLGKSSSEVLLPDEPYWADLARILVACQLRKASNVPAAVSLEREIGLQPIRELLDRKATRGTDEC